MVNFCLCSLFLFVGHLSALSDKSSAILTNPPGTKFTAEVLINEYPNIPESRIDDIKLMLPFLAHYNETFEPSISDPTQRCDAFKSAAQKGNLSARVLYAWCFASGVGRPNDNTKALKHYRLAADRGSPEGQVMAFSLSLENATNDSDLKAARNYLDLAVKQGDGFAQWFRGFIDFVSDERQAAVSLFKQSAEKSHVLGELFYGICLLFGFGTKRDERKGVEYLTRVKKQGFAVPVLFSGLALHSADLHPEIATECFEFAAKSDIAVAQAYYAWALENGFGVEKNTKLAAEFYKKAADVGYEPARMGYDAAQHQKVSK